MTGRGGDRCPLGLPHMAGPREENTWPRAGDGGREGGKEVLQEGAQLTLKGRRITASTVEMRKGGLGRGREGKKRRRD